MQITEIHDQISKHTIEFMFNVAKCAGAHLKNR